MRKRYALFEGETYYPTPGWNSFIDAFDTQEEAVSVGKSHIFTKQDKVFIEWWQVVDLESLRAIASEGSSYTGRPLPSNS